MHPNLPETKHHFRAQIYMPFLCGVTATLNQSICDPNVAGGTSGTSVSLVAARRSGVHYYAETQTWRPGSTPAHDSTALK